MLVHKKTRLKVVILISFIFKYYIVNIRTKIQRYIFVEFFFNLHKCKIKSTYPYKFLL